MSRRPKRKKGILRCTGISRNGLIKRNGRYGQGWFDVTALPYAGGLRRPWRGMGDSTRPISWLEEEGERQWTTSSSTTTCLGAFEGPIASLIIIRLFAPFVFLPFFPFSSLSFFLLYYARYFFVLVCPYVFSIFSVLDILIFFSTGRRICCRPPSISALTMSLKEMLIVTIVVYDHFRCHRRT